MIRFKRGVLFIALSSMLLWPLSLFAEEPLLVGIFPRRSPATTEKLFTPLTDYLSQKLGREVKLETTHDFASFWERVSEQRYDLVHYNQYHYVRSHQESGYRVILQNEEFGHKEIAAAIIVRKKAGIETLSDLKGRKIVFGGGRTAMMAYITATYLLRSAGLNKGDYFEQFALTPPKAVIATFYHQSAAAGAGDYVLDLPKVKKEINTGEMKYLAVSEHMAHLPWAVKGNMPDATATKIRQLLSGLKTTDQGRAILKQAALTSLVPVSDADFDIHRKIIKSVLDETY